jgi:hypothetical protein
LLKAFHRQFVRGFHAIYGPETIDALLLENQFLNCFGMNLPIRLLSIDFDGTLVSHVTEPVFDAKCMEVIRRLQEAGTVWAINTGRSVDLLEKGIAEFALPIRPDFILTTERDVFRPGKNGHQWEPFGDWNDRCARDHADLFSSADSVLAEFVDFATTQTKARLIYNSQGLEGLAAEGEEEMDRLIDFIGQARAGHPKLDYQRNGIYLRFCHADYHGKTSSQRAIIIMMCQCWMAGSQRCRRVRPTRFPRSKMPFARRAATSRRNSTAPGCTKRCCTLRGEIRPLRVDLGDATTSPTHATGSHRAWSITVVVGGFFSRYGRGRRRARIARD